MNFHRGVVGSTCHEANRTRNTTAAARPVGRSRSILGLVMLLALSFSAMAQVAEPVKNTGANFPEISNTDINQALAVRNLPKFVVTGGGGFSNPGGSFAYTSVSALVLPQNTYTTLAQEYTVVKGKVQSLTLAGISKPLYQFSVITAGLTGLGGGAVSNTGTNSLIGQGQFFVNIQWGHLPVGNTITVMKNTDGSGFKATLGFSLFRN